MFCYYLIFLYLKYKLIEKWFLGEGDYVIVRVEYDFDGEGEEELLFRVGDIFRLVFKGK